MTKEITRANILQELQDRLKLREWEISPFLFSETIVPVYDIIEHIQRPVADYKEESITSGPAGKQFFTVPQDERWYLERYNVIFMAAGAYKVSGLFILRANQKSPSSNIYLDLTLGQTVSYIVTLPNPVRLDSGDRVYLYIDDYTSTAALRLYIDYIVEVLR